MNTQKISIGDFWKLVINDLGKQSKFEELLSFIKNQPEQELNQDMLGLISKLKEKGYKVGLLSNNTLEAAKKMRNSELLNYFDCILVSAEIGCAKPSKEAFQLFAKSLNVKLNELVFVDDTEKSLSFSKEIGFYPILFTDYKNLLKKFGELGIV